MKVFYSSLLATKTQYRYDALTFQGLENKFYTVSSADQQLF